MKCKECQFHNPEGVKFCGACGRSMAKDKKTATSCKRPAPFKKSYGINTCYYALVPNHIDLMECYLHMENYDSASTAIKVA
jgi:hypothetical protein